LVRTSVYRLAQEKWLERTASGRRSYYGLTDAGRRQTVDAEHRIYAAGSSSWDGQWRLVSIPQKTISRTYRTGLKKELKWQGFGTLTADTLIHPTADLPTVCRALAERDLADKAKVFCGHTINDHESPQSLLDRCFDLEQIARESAFTARVLLIHDYRRILLHDPDLPEELLPAHWPGTRARKRCAAIYRTLQEAADRWTVSVCDDELNLLKPPDKHYRQRFSDS
jgi:phenylacetic acid degradation operon negative regulatory protein